MTLDELYQMLEQDDRAETKSHAKHHGNQSVKVLIEHNGKTQCLAEWGREYGMAGVTLSCRLKRGWSMEDALKTPVRPKMSLA